MSAIDQAPLCNDCGLRKSYCMERGIYQCEPCQEQARMAKVEAELEYVERPRSSPPPSNFGVEVDLVTLEKTINEQKKQAQRVTIIDCKSCGAQVETPAGKPVSECMFCGRKTELEEVDALTHEHQVFIPFRIGEDEAVAEMHKLLDSLWLRPSGLKAKITAQSIKKIYLPFWCYDVDANAKWGGTVRCWDEPGIGRLVGRKGRLRTVSVSGSNRKDYNDWLVCASKGMAGDLIRQVEPFDTEGAELRKLYDDLDGVPLEIGTTSPRLGWKQAKEEIQAEQYDDGHADSLIQANNPVACDVSIRGTVRFGQPRAKAAVLPLYIFSHVTPYGSCKLVVNGETGAAGAQIPYSFLKAGPVVAFVLFMVLIATVLSGGLLIPAAAVYLGYRWWKNHRGVEEKAELFTER